MGGILNALPAWDIVEYKRRDVSGLTYVQRRALLEKVVKEVRLYNRRWHTIRALKPGEDPREFYERIVSEPLPWGEGVVVKLAGETAGGVWFKVKATDCVDLPVVEFIEGTGKYAGSLGAIVVEDQHTGSRGEVGSFAIPDSHRDWIWANRDRLVGSVAKVQGQEITARGVPRAGVFTGFHESKGSPIGLEVYDPLELEMNYA